MRCEFGDELARPGDNRKMSLTEDLRIVLPTGDVGKCIRAGNEKKLSRSILELMKSAQRRRRVRRPLVLQLHVRCPPARPTRDGKRHHSEPVKTRCNRLH